MTSRFLSLPFAVLLAACPSDDETAPVDTGGDEEEEDALPACPAADEPLFFAPVVSLDLVQAVAPMGHFGADVFHHIHGGYYVCEQECPEDFEPVAVYMPTDVHVYEVGAKTYTYLGETEPFDYDFGVMFMVCEGVESYFYHLSALSPELLAELDPNTPCTTTDDGLIETKDCKYALDFDMPISAFVGTVADPAPPSAFDFGLVDRRQPPHAFARPERYRNQSFYRACAFEAYSEPLRTMHLDRIGRVGTPACGPFMADIPGTAKGNWFLTPEPEFPAPEEHRLAIGEDAHTEAVEWISTNATEIGFTREHYEVTHTGRKNRDSAEISDDGLTYCFTGVQIDAIYILQLTNPTTLQLERRSIDLWRGVLACDDPADYVFGEDVVTFYR